MNQQNLPCPAHKKGSQSSMERLTALHEKLESDSLCKVEHLTAPHDSPWSVSQVLWLATRPIEQLGNHAATVYEAVEQEGLGGLLLPENVKQVKRERALQEKRGPCYHCGTSAPLCKGCGEFICIECAVSEPEGEHDPDDHLDNEEASGFVDDVDWEEERW